MADKEFEDIMKILPPEILDPDFTEEALRHFQKLLDQSKNGAPEEQEEAIETLRDYQKKADRLRADLAGVTGKSEEEIKRIMTNQSNYSQEEWGRLQEVVKEMDPVVQHAQPYRKKVKRKNPKNWTKT
ncbi:MAG: hypothetical protein K9M07_01760 [Simkaniaceae bacterium]|nr:hypothetical protein [Simkaniaceae bacterium]MCF7851948.1 hypothetical protein [Simkaniaceae bacterium]